MRTLLVEAVVLAGLCRLGLCLLSFSTMQRILDRVPKRLAEEGTGRRPEEVAWAVRAAGRYVPRATCLVQALTGQVLLARAGHASRVYIGVAFDKQRTFQAHAWLESGGKVLIGETESKEQYTPLLAWERRKC